MTRDSSIRDSVRAELDTWAAVAPASHARHVARFGGNPERIVDWWLTFDIAHAVRTLHLGRYRHSPEAREAIRDARAALDRLAEVLRTGGSPDR